MWEGLGGPIRLDRPKGGQIDPTLDDCCRREVETNRTQTALQQTLRRHDVVAHKERRRKHLITIPNHAASTTAACRCCYDPNHDGGEYRALTEARAARRQRQQAKEEEEDEARTAETHESAKQDDNESEEDSDDDDEFDYLLEEDLPGGNLYEHEERRRAELEYSMLQHEVALQHGYGVHRQMDPSRVLRSAGLGGGTTSSSPAPPLAVVLHLFDPHSMASASLDLYLEELAETYRGTKFLRSLGRSVLLMDAEMSKASLPRLRPTSDMPALVAIRDGVVVAACPRLQGLLSDDSEDAVVFPGEVRAWLDRAGVLLERPPPFEELCLIRPEEEALMDSLVASAQQQPDEAPRYDCGVPTCNKKFPHEHVGIKNEQQDGLIVQEEDVVESAV